MDNRSKMEQIYMSMAFLLSKRSVCRRLSVGCVITSLDLEQVYSVGYNGNAKGLGNNCDRNEPGNCGCIHSEINALIKCPVKDSTKVVFLTDMPCIRCSKVLINSGLSKLYYSREYRDKSGLEQIKSCGIIVERIINFPKEI